MKNITPQYKALLEGKITKADFLTSARKQFPDYVSTMNNYQDTVTILKKKGLLSEVQDLDKTTSQLDAEGDKKAFYLVDETGDVIDSVMAIDSQEASDYFEGEYEGIGSSLTVIHTSNPDELRGGVAEDVDKKDIEALRAGALHEAVEKPEGSYKKVTGKDLYSFFNEIDRVNPYEVKKGINIEMGIEYSPVPNYFTDDFNPESLAKATRKVLKNLQKDPAYYTNMISLPTEKRTNMLQKPAEVKVKADGATKIKGFTDEKGNTEENLGKKERAKGSPEGVKEMKPSKKSMGGLKTMKSNDKLPKGVELMKEADLTNNPAGLNAIGTSDLAARAKEIYKAQEEFNKSMRSYDWYAEMSDDSRKWDAQQAMNSKLKTLAKLIGTEKALEIFNTYAPADRKEDASFFAETVDMKSKLKELVMQEVKKRLQEKITTQDVAQAAAAGETLNIPSSDNQAIQAAKSKKVSFTTYE